MGRPTILMYNLNSPKGAKLHLICLKLNIRVRAVVPSEYDEPLGALAGFLPAKGTVAPDTGFRDEMLVFVDFGGKLLNCFLQETRAAHLPSIALKAVLTPTNIHWNSIQLHDEIQREREAMRHEQSIHDANQ